MSYVVSFLFNYWYFTSKLLKLEARTLVISVKLSSQMEIVRRIEEDIVKKIDGRVLLVDDEEQFLALLSERLEVRGLKVNSVTSGEEALAMVEGRNFDVIVVDLAMPGIDGLETLKRLKEQDSDLEIIILTGHGTVHSGITAMKLGAEDFLEKPVDIGILMEKIDEAKNKRLLVLEQKSQEEIKKILTNRGW